MFSYSAYDDAQLLELLKTGDEAAFTELYNRYWDKLLFIAGIKLRNLSVAEELVQDVFTDIWNRHGELDFKGPVNAYLAVSMKHKVINAQAKMQRALRYEAYASRHQLQVDHSTEQLLDFEQAKERLAKLVAALPEKCRITYRLSREEGFSNKEIAQQLQVTEKAVEGNLSRALKSLRAGFGQFFFFLWSLLLFVLLLLRF